MHHKLKHMKDVLICAVEHEIDNLENANCKELGEAIDMIKDLEEAIYYCTITEAIGEKGNGQAKDYYDKVCSELEIHQNPI